MLEPSTDEEKQEKSQSQLCCVHDALETILLCPKAPKSISQESVVHLGCFILVLTSSVNWLDCAYSGSALNKKRECEGYCPLSVSCKGAGHGRTFPLGVEVLCRADAQTGAEGERKEVNAAFSIIDSFPDPFRCYPYV